MPEPLNLTLQLPEIAGWKDRFTDYLAQQPGGENLIVKPKRIPGTAGATREDQINIRDNTRAVNRNSLVASVGAIITAATLVMAPAGGEPADTVTCTITGENGATELKISTAGPIPENVIEACLSKAGTPTSIEFTVDPQQASDGEDSDG